MNEEFDKVMTPLMESVKENYPIDESQKGIMERVLLNQVEAMNESTYSTDIQTWTPVIMPLVRRTQSTLIAHELVATQPLAQESGYIFTIAFRYTGSGLDADDNVNGKIHPIAGGQIIQLADTTLLTKGDVVKVGTDEANVIHVEKGLILVDKKIASADAELKKADDTVIGNVEATFSNELSFRRVLVNYSGSLPANESELLGYNHAQVGFSIEKTMVETKVRRLKGEYTLEMMNNLQKVFGLSAHAELSNIMANEVKSEIDREIVDFVNGIAKPVADFKIGGANASGSTRFEMEGASHLITKIMNESRQIGVETKISKGNVLLVSPKVATILETMVTTFRAVDVKANLNTGVNAVSVIGTIQGMKVIVDNFAQKEYCTVLLKGNDMSSACAIYSPYIPINFTEVTDYKTSGKGLFLYSQYAISENPLNRSGNGAFARTFVVDFTDSTVI